MVLQLSLSKASQPGTVHALSACISLSQELPHLQKLISALPAAGPQVQSDPAWQKWVPGSRPKLSFSKQIHKEGTVKAEDVKATEMVEFAQ